MKSSRVLFIHFDAGDADIIDRFIDEGLLPNIARIKKEGAYSRLQTLEHSLAESVQVSLFTGTLPEAHGFHGPNQFDPLSYAVETNLESGFDQIPPFYDLGDDFDVLTFDLPMCPILGHRAYTQIVHWGNHGFSIGGGSAPPEAGEDLIEKYGQHPEYGIDFALLGSSKSCQAIFERQIEGIKLRSDATRYLLDKHPWDLALTSTSESHTGLHYLMQHPGNEAFYETLQGRDPVREIYSGIDEYLGNLIEAVGAETEILITAAEGMTENHSEVPCIAYLPEMLFRYAFPGKSAFDYHHPLADLPEDTPDEVVNNWVVQTSRRAKQASGLTKKLRELFSEKTAVRIERFLDLEAAPFPPESRQTMDYQPSMWLEPYWPHMRAFCLPTFSDGFIRLNVKGREARGIVSPEEFSCELEKIRKALDSYKFEGTDESAIETVITVRNTPYENPNQSPADLIIIWKDRAIGTIESESFGKIGPLPALRAGRHTAKGFMLGCGPRLSTSGVNENGSIVDIAPTILDLMGKEPPRHLSGSSLIAKN